MDRKKKIDNKKRQCRVVTKFHAPPAVANAIANSYGHWGAWESFITKVEEEVRG